MRHRTFVLLSWVVIAGAALAGAPPSGQGSAAGEEHVGTWTGTFEGNGSGGIELTLEKDQSGAITGKLAVSGEPNYTVALKSLEFDGKKMSAKYDYPPDQSTEVVIAATFDGSAASGTWSARDKASGNEVATGTWTVKKKT